MAQNRGLGRGLDALLKGYVTETDELEVRSIALKSIVPNPQQPRKAFSPEALEDLSASIKAQGILQPIVVRRAEGAGPDMFELVAGERRFRASELAGLEEIPAIIRDISDEQSLAIALIENLQREDLNPIEEARGLLELRRRFGLNQEQISQKVGKSRSAVANLLRLLTLPEAMQAALSKGTISPGHARALLAVTNDELRARLFDRMAHDGLTVRQAESQVSYWKAHGQLPELGTQPTPDDPSPADVKTGRSKQGTSTQDGTLKDLAKSLSTRIPYKVVIRGDAQKGTVALRYTTQEELAAITSFLESLES